MLSLLANNINDKSYHRMHRTLIPFKTERFDNLPCQIRISDNRCDFVTYDRFSDVQGPYTDVIQNRKITLVNVLLCTVFIAKRLSVTATYFRRLPFIKTKDK